MKLDTMAPNAATETDNRSLVFDSKDSPVDEEALSHLLNGVEDADLAAPPVVLPDFHHKGTMEMPSSIAVATRGTIRPTLTSASLNCGMALVALDIERPSIGSIVEFYRKVRERFPFPAAHRRDLSVEDVLRCAAEGARFAVDRFGVEPSERERIELNGRVPIEAYGGIGRIRQELPWSVLQLSRMRFGTIGPSNHFIELQQVEEILDPAAAARLGVRRDQVTLQYHGGGGVLAGELGALFGRRKRRTKPLRAQMAITKPLFHLASSQSMSELKLRLSLYFSDEYPAIPRDSSEGERLMLASALSMNYGFAYRLAAYAGLRQLARESFGDHPSRLIVDSPHNSIYEEDVNGAVATVHRHNSCRAYPASLMPKGTAFGDVGQALLLPGTNRTSSYLCVAGEGVQKSLHSTCHGAGTVIDDFASRGLSATDPKYRKTMRFRYSDEVPRTVPHLDDRGVNEALSILMDHDLARPVARMRPFAVLN
ncbi:MAG: RtcB family protein [Actinomycetota bacterium]|nr:RtcB family protein [Actinomycetota bacterium]